MSILKYESLKKEAERNLKVGRFLSAAREFQVLSIMAEKDGFFELAGDFAAKSGDCWLRYGQHENAALMYEQAARCFHVSRNAALKKTYLKKAVAEFVLVSRSSALPLDKVKFIIRAAKCGMCLDDQLTVNTLLSKALSLSHDFIKDNLSIEDCMSAVSHLILAIKCCEKLADIEKAVKFHALLKELVISVLRSFTEPPSKVQVSLIKQLIKYCFSLFNSDKFSETYINHTSELVAEYIKTSLKFENLDLAEAIINAFSEFKSPPIMELLKKPPINSYLASLISLSIKKSNITFASSLIQFLQEVSDMSIKPLLLSQLEIHLKEFLDKAPEELKLRLKNLVNSLKKQ